jgi:hypothetical protein
MVIMMAVISSCVYIPTPEHILMSDRAAISSKAIKSLEPYETTRAEVLLLFGDPTNRYDKDRIFVYRWELVHGYFYIYPTDILGATSKLHYLCCEFTPGNLLSRFKHFKGGTTFDDPTERMNEWMAEAESPFYQRLQNPNLMK